MMPHERHFVLSTFNPLPFLALALDHIIVSSVYLLEFVYIVTIVDFVAPLI